MTLEQVLADFRGEAAVLRAHGQKAQADSMERVCDGVHGVMADYLDWLSEEEARIASGWGLVRLRRAFAGWQAVNMAEWRGEGRKARRMYRRLIIPRRPNVIQAYAEGRKSA